MAFWPDVPRLPRADSRLTPEAVDAAQRTLLIGS